MLAFEFSDEGFESTYVPIISNAYSDASKLLNNLPENLTIKFTDNGAEEQSGVGGFAESSHQLNVAIAKGFSDSAAQLRNLRAVIFHELFHINHGFTLEQSPFTALDAAIYEGCAVQFEREYGNGEAAYADFSQHTEEELYDWSRQLEAVGTKYFEDNDTWHKWAFYNPELNQKWIVYKVGTWVVGEILNKNTLNVLELQDKTPSEILKLKS
jgi:hypothetical protein